MTNKFFASVLALLFVFGISAATTVQAQTKRTKGSSPLPQKNQLVASLPASDAVAYLDMQRLLNEALPQIFSANPAKLTEINEQIDRIKNETGLDVRQFEQIALGVNLRQTATAKMTVEPVVLARGKYNSDALLTLAKIALKGKYREEKSGAKSVYVFAAREILNENKAKLSGGSSNKILDFLLRRMPSEIAVATVDANTLAIGSLARVRETVESKARIGGDLSMMLSRKSNAMMSFAANTPAGLSQFIDLDDDMFGQSLASIRQIYGTADVSGGNILATVAAKSTTAEQANSLSDTLSGLQGLLKGILGSARSEDKKAYARILDSAKITRTGTEISIDLQVSNADIALLVE